MRKKYIEREQRLKKELKEKEQKKRDKINKQQHDYSLMERLARQYGKRLVDDV